MIYMTFTVVGSAGYKLQFGQLKLLRDRMVHRLNACLSKALPFLGHLWRDSSTSAVEDHIWSVI